GVMIFETTRDYAVIVPLMISNLLSFFISARLQPKPIYDELAKQDRIQLPGKEAESGAGQLQVAAILRPALHSLDANTPAAEALAALRAANLRALPVRSSRGLEGMISTEKLELVGGTAAAKTLLDVVLPDAFPH